MNTKTIITIIIVLLVLVGIATVYQQKNPDMDINVQNSTTTNSVNSKASMVKYESSEQKISFEYPSNLYLKEKNAQNSDVPKLTLVLVENSQENRDLLDGKSEIAREGPTSITVDVYENHQKLNAKEWVSKTTTWAVATSATTTIAVAGEEGITYTWSGLYEGKSIIVTKGDRAYVLAVSWMSPEDQIIRDFDMILNSLSLK